MGIALDRFILDGCLGDGGLPTPEQCADAILKPTEADPRVLRYLELTPEYKEYIRRTEEEIAALIELGRRLMQQQMKGKGAENLSE